MSCLVHSGALHGIHGQSVQVEVDLLRRLPSISIVGLPGNAVRESADRVRSAIQESGFEFPRKRVVVNLAPAGLKKTGAAFDLPIAVGILIASGKIPEDLLEDSLFSGELSLSGKLRPIRGALSLALMARKLGHKRLILPKENAEEAAVIPELEVLAFSNLKEVVAWMGGKPMTKLEVASATPRKPDEFDLSEVRGQLKARRAMEIAAAGGHNLLMIGSPGCGKTMLAVRMPTILPALEFEESIDITRIHSAAGLHTSPGLIWKRPFRAPHHSLSMAGMIGNRHLQPGEASLSHNGVLFLDELAEFRRDVLEALRAPLENREVMLVRSAGSVRFPSNFSLVAAANPCPCGFYGHPLKACDCSPSIRSRYQNRISGPLRDRMDLQIWINPTAPEALVKGNSGESSAKVRSRVENARRTQSIRYKSESFHSNAQLQGDKIRQYSCISSSSGKLLECLIREHALSGRGWARLIKVARTIADLEGNAAVEEEHILEAAAFRGDHKVEKCV